MGTAAGCSTGAARAPKLHSLRPHHARARTRAASAEACRRQVCRPRAHSRAARAQGPPTGCSEGPPRADGLGCAARARPPTGCSEARPKGCLEGCSEGCSGGASVPSTRRGLLGRAARRPAAPRAPPQHCCGCAGPCGGAGAWAGAVPGFMPGVHAHPAVLGRVMGRPGGKRQTRAPVLQRAAHAGRMTQRRPKPKAVLKAWHELGRAQAPETVSAHAAWRCARLRIKLLPGGGVPATAVLHASHGCRAASATPP